MADIRLAIAVDSAGAIKSIKTFNDEVDKVPASASKAGAGIDTLTSRLDKFASGIGIGTGIGIAVKGFDMLAAGAQELVTVLTNGAKALGLYADKIVTLGQRTGLAISSLQVFNSMAKTSGTDVDSLAKAAVKMEIAIGKGDESFKKLGLSVSALKAMSPDAAFAKVAESIGGISDPMQRAAAAVAIFGKSGAEMLPVFSSNIEEARQKAEELGLVLSDKTMTSAEALGDAIDTLGMAFDAFLMRLAGVVAQSPALMAAIEEMGKLFGVLSKSVDGNTSALTKWIDYGLDVAADAIWTLLFAVEKAIAAFGVFGGTIGMVTKAAADYSGLTGLIGKMKDFTEQTRLAMKAKSDWANIDMGGSGVLLPGRSLPKQGATGGTFDASPATIAKIVELSVKSQRAQQLIDFSAVPSGTLQGGMKNYNLWGDKSKFLPPELAGNTHVGGANAAIVKSSFTASQALQNLANIAATSGSKLGKGLASILAGGAGIGSGISGLKSMSGLSGITGLLGKAGMYGQIASSVLSIGSSIFGLFKKKPKEPPPEPPKQATAEAWRNFTGDQQSKGAAGVLAGVSGIRVTSPEDMAAQASIASQSFWAMFKQQGLIKAADAFKAVRDKMIETFKSAGASDESIGAMLGGISSMVDLAGNDAFRGAADGANGFAESLAAIANQQLPMTISQFKAYEQQAVAGFEQMKQAALDQGLSMQDAITAAAQGSGQYLNTLQDAAKKYGFDLSGGTQGIIDQATAAGVSFGADAQERLIMSLDALTETLGGAPPKFQAAIAGAGSEVGGRINEAAEGGITGGGLNVDGLADSFAAKMGATFDKFLGLAASQPPIVVESTVNLDGAAMAMGLADAVDRGVGAALVTALEGRG